MLLRFVLLSLVHEYASHIIVPFSRSLPFQKQEEPASSASIIALLGSPNLKFHHARIWTGTEQPWPLFPFFPYSTAPPPSCLRLYPFSLPCPVIYYSITTFGELVKVGHIPKLEYEGNQSWYTSLSFAPLPPSLSLSFFACWPSSVLESHRQ